MRIHVSWLTWQCRYMLWCYLKFPSQNNWWIVVLLLLFITHETCIVWVCSLQMFLKMSNNASLWLSGSQLGFKINYPWWIFGFVRVVAFNFLHFTAINKSTVKSRLRCLNCAEPLAMVSGELGWGGYKENRTIRKLFCACHTVKSYCVTQEPTFGYWTKSRRSVF